MPDHECEWRIGYDLHHWYVYCVTHYDRVCTMNQDEALTALNEHTNLKRVRRWAWKVVGHIDESVPGMDELLDALDGGLRDIMGVQRQDGKGRQQQRVQNQWLLE